MSGFTENTCVYPVGCWEDSEYGGCLCVPCFDAGKGVNRVEYTALPARLIGLHRVGSSTTFETTCEFCGDEVSGVLMHGLAEWGVAR